MLVRTAGEIRGKSIVWTARVFTEAPKIVEKNEKSRKQNPFTFLVRLAALLSTSPRSSFVFSQRGRRTRRLPQDAHPFPRIAQHSSLPQSYHPCARADGKRGARCQCDSRRRRFTRRVVAAGARATGAASCSAETRRVDCLLYPTEWLHRRR